MLDLRVVRAGQGDQDDAAALRDGLDGVTVPMQAQKSPGRYPGLQWLEMFDENQYLAGAMLNR